MCAPRVTRHTSRRYSCCCHTLVNVLSTVLVPEYFSCIQGNVTRIYFYFETCTEVADSSSRSQQLYSCCKMCSLLKVWRRNEERHECIRSQSTATCCETFTIITVKMYFINISFIHVPYGHDCILCFLCCGILSVNVISETRMINVFIISSTTFGSSGLKASASGRCPQKH
jgi:hypothetical protein